MTKQIAMEQLKNYIRTRITVTEDELDQIVSKFQFKRIKKKQYFLEAGDICLYEAFILKGIFKIFYLKSDGTEHILTFAMEDWWMGDIASFNCQEPAELHIQALEDAEILVIAKAEKELLYETYPQIERLFRILAQRSQVTMLHRIISMIGFNAQERYLDFLKKYPKIYPRISNRQLASYLGITQEFLSRLKHQLLKPNKKY